MNNLIKAGVLAASLALAAAAHATPLYSAAVFGPGDAQITFDEVAMGANEVVANQFAAYGLTFGPGLRSGVKFADPANFSGQFLASAGLLEPYSIFFNNTVDAAGAYWEFDPNTITTVAAYYQGALVESYLYANSDCCNTTAFLGFQGIAFDEIRMSNLVDGTSLIMDNLHFSEADVVGDVPEPFSAALLGIGALGLGVARRRQHRAA
ncbi:hypothetical protein CR105_23390 [Massilia eurypsychrophila]|jgi:hypothetical protein|uniref:PEP-CTERM protein-sorting domain-containing protein n=1 Tax=Massilia eurypsychrophila TaxID=1485217 RepID=A0A2G8T998_9BURK|nr:PEP-CTERM sorting domain-containing protein [Massilia eurypsychrophila]PIL42559.1 hypothetical protein CR105_23390 [Massilia eurypsychrophila]